MRLFEAILDANRRAVSGDLSAGIHVADYTAELPIVALTCIDPRLNRLLPGALALPDEQFIWLRNAGNIITSPLSSTMRSISLACAVKGGREIVVIGHTDCKVRHTTINELTELFKGLGIPRSQLPDNIAEYFGVFDSEHHNVVRAVELIRQSPLIGPRVPVQGLMVDIRTGQLEWVVNGYDVLERSNAPAPLQFPTLGGVIDEAASRAGFHFGEMKFPDTKIGEIANSIIHPASAKPTIIGTPVPPATPAPPAPSALPKPPTPSRAIPIPPPIHLHPSARERKK